MKWSVKYGVPSKADAKRIVAAVLWKATGETGSLVQNLRTHGGLALFQHFFVQWPGDYRAMFPSREWTLGPAPGRRNFDAGSTGFLTHYLPRQGKDPAGTQHGLAIRHADPLCEYQRARAAQQHGFALQPGVKQRRRQVIRIQADGSEEPCHPGQIEATNAERQVRKSRQHAAMRHVLAVAMALFDPKPKGQRPVIPPDHDGADGFQKRPSGRARHEAFRHGKGDRLIQGRATFRRDAGGDPIPEALPGKRPAPFALALPRFAPKRRHMRSHHCP